MENNKQPPSSALMAVGKIGDALENLLLVVGALTLLLFFFAVIYDVAARTLNNSVFWAQDAAIFSYFWCIFIAGAICLRRNEHFSIELFRHLPKKAAFVKRLLVILVMAAFTYYIFRYGWAYAKMSWTRRQAASGLRLSYAIISMPVSGVGFAYFLLEQMILLFTGRELQEISPKHAAEDAGKEDA